MAPKSLLTKNRIKSKNNIFIKKLNHSLVINNDLRKRIEELSDQNKELSTTKNNLSLEKLSLQNEINSIKNSNTQLNGMHKIMNKKLAALEQTIQNCIPALVTISQCIPSMLESVREMSKLEIKEVKQEKKRKQTKTVLPMVNGMTIITHPIIPVNRLDMFPIVESPSRSPSPSPPSTNTELTPKRPRKLSYRSSPNSQPKLIIEPYVRVKDVATLLKNSKAVPNRENPQRQLNESLGEGPSWLHDPENQTRNSNNDVIAIQSVDNFPNSVIINEIEANVTTIASTSSGNTENTIDRTEERNSELISPINSSIPRNITRRKRTKRSSESSSASDIDDSTSSSRPSRSATKNINYKEKSLGGKLRR